MLCAHLEDVLERWSHLRLLLWWLLRLLLRGLSDSSCSCWWAALPGVRLMLLGVLLLLLLVRLLLLLLSWYCCGSWNCWPRPPPPPPRRPRTGCCCCVRRALISARRLSNSPLMMASRGAVSTPYAPSPCCRTGSQPAPETRPPGEKAGASPEPSQARKSFAFSVSAPAHCGGQRGAVSRAMLSPSANLRDDSIS